MSDYLPEIVFSSSDVQVSRKIAQLVKEGKLRKILPRVYTSNIVEAQEVIIQRNLWKLIAHLFPQSILSHRSALEFKPSPQNNVYLTGKNRRNYKWGNLTLRFTKGFAKQEDDHPILGELYVSSLERACLENLLPSRLVNGEKRIVEQTVIEDRLLQILNTRGEEGLNAFRDRARNIATNFGWEKAFKKLNQLISSLLSTKPAHILKSPLATAQALGEPYDPFRLELFQELIQVLKNQLFEDRPQKTKTTTAYNNFAFYESYFSNYIEGTTFTIEEASEIVFKGVFIANRSSDSHDIKGTYQICANRFEMGKIPDSPEQFISLLRARHAIVMAGRLDKQPGTFKDIANRAGSSFFVEPALVTGTLKQGFELMGALTHPLARAIYMMFLVSEVHPFLDGNGRVARIMMNAELVQAQQSKIIIPNVYREDYILNLKKLTQQKKPQGFINMMNKIHQYSHWLSPISLEALNEQLRETNAFKESEEAVIVFPFR